jgi:hypothetical protein
MLVESSKGPVRVDIGGTIDQPSLFIDGIEKKLSAINGVRLKYFHDEFVVKLTDALHEVNQEAELLKIVSDEDREYFPKVLGSNDLFVVQEFVSLEFGRPTAADLELVESLMRKYRLCDVYAEDVINPDSNWGFNTATRRPVIYDFFKSVR